MLIFQKETLNNKFVVPEYIYVNVEGHAKCDVRLKWWKEGIIKYKAFVSGF